MGSACAGSHAATVIEFLCASMPTQVIGFVATTGLLRMRLWRRKVLTRDRAWRPIRHPSQLSFARARRYDRRPVAPYCLDPIRFVVHGAGPPPAAPRPCAACHRYRALICPHAECRVGVAAWQTPPGVRPTPCHVMTFPSGGSRGFVSVRPPPGAFRCSWVRIRHTPVPQPVQDGVPTVRLKLIVSTGPRYSTPASRLSVGPGGQLMRVNSRRSELAAGTPGRIAVKSPSVLHAPNMKSVQ